MPLPTVQYRLDLLLLLRTMRGSDKRNKWRRLLYFVQPVVSQHIGRGCAFGWIQPQHWEEKGFNVRRSGFIEIFCQQKVANVQ